MPGRVAEGAQQKKTDAAGRGGDHQPAQQDEGTGAAG
jgi:hypothetical protein